MSDSESSIPAAGLPRPAIPPPAAPHAPSRSSRLPEVLKGKASMLMGWAALITAAGSSVATFVDSRGTAKSADVVAAKSEIVTEMKALHQKVTELEKRADTSEEHDRVQDQRIEYHADWICEDNEGPPHRSFDCYNLTWEGPPAGRHAPIRRTNRPYPRN